MIASRFFSDREVIMSSRVSGRFFSLILGIAWLVAFASTAHAIDLSSRRDNLPDLKSSERRSMAIANWWKHKFKDDPAFSNASYVHQPNSLLRQNSVEEESR